MNTNLKEEVLVASENCLYEWH